MCVQLVAEGPSRQRCSFHLGVGGCHGDVTSRLKVATGRGKGEEREVASLGSEDLLGVLLPGPFPCCPWPAVPTVASLVDWLGSPWG